MNSRAGLGWSYLKSGQSEQAVEYYSNLFNPRLASLVTSTTYLNL